MSHVSTPKSLQAEPSLSLASPLPRRLLAWASERFPLPNVIVSALFFACALISGRAATGTITVGPSDVLGVLSGVGFFLLLRVFDEHKDYADDVQNYPERVLSRGLVTLDQLKALGPASVLVQLVATLAADRGIGRASYAFVLVMTYSLLMLKEFFIHDWLKPRLVLYAASHMLVTPLAMLWFFLMGAHGAELGEPLLWLLVLSYAAGTAFELTRKMRGPEEERPEVDSYTKQLGLTGSVVALSVALGVAGVSEVMLLRSLSSAWTWLSGFVALSFLPTALSLARFHAAASEAGRKRNENAVGLVLLVCHVAPIAAAILERGITWH